MKIFKTLLMALSGIIFIPVGYWMYIKIGAGEDVPLFTVSFGCYVLWLIIAAVCRNDDFSTGKTVLLMSVFPVVMVVFTSWQSLVLKHLYTPVIGVAVQLFEMRLIRFSLPVFGTVTITKVNISIALTLMLVSFLGCKSKELYLGF